MLDGPDSRGTRGWQIPPLTQNQTYEWNIGSMNLDGSQSSHSITLDEKVLLDQAVQWQQGLMLRH